MLVVRGLDESVNEETLHYEFSKYAPIKVMIVAVILYCSDTYFTFWFPVLRPRSNCMITSIRICGLSGTSSRMFPEVSRLFISIRYVCGRNLLSCNTTISATF